MASENADILEEKDDERASSLVILVTAGTLVIALAWAAFFKLDEITKGQGKVIPSSREQIIGSLDSGVLSAMYVKEGDFVEKDQVLLQMDDARSGANYREAEEKYLALLAQDVRLKAEAYNTPLVFPPEVQKVPNLVTQETNAYNARRKALNASLTAINKAIAATARELAITAPLVKDGLISEVELLRLRRQEAEMLGQKAEKENRYITDANAELVRVASELAQTKENASARQDAYTHAKVKSPMRGVVKNIQITTVGGVIQAGQPILEIVPTEDEMLVEAYIKPSEVAFLRVGQAATVKLTAYDFNKYGALEGELENLSPDTLKDDKPKKPGSNPVDLEEGFYRILVRIKNSDVERKGVKLIPTPGMTASVEIRTGQKTVLEYLFRPLQNVGQALRER